MTPSPSHSEHSPEAATNNFNPELAGPAASTPERASSSSPKSPRPGSEAHSESRQTPPALPPRPPNLSQPSSGPSRPSSSIGGSTGDQRPPHIANSYTRNARLESQGSSSTSTTLRRTNNATSGNAQALSSISGPGAHFPMANLGPSRPRRCPQSQGRLEPWLKKLSKKYVLLCCLCGLLCVVLGALYLAIYFVLKSNTSSMHYFQTLPTYVPAIPLLITGLLIMSFSRRRNRNNYVIKICGCLCLVCAVLCVVVTVTTTVIHMNRLQTLRECVYQAATRTCTCFAGILDPITQEAGMHYVFTGSLGCDSIHGVLYSCLRALFGISVIGILVCIFSCMLVYQLQSHEKKKEYWEQLETRCRYLHRRSAPHHHHHMHLQRQLPLSISAMPLTTPTSHCECCTAGHEPLYEDGLWTTSAALSGNLYSPNPVSLSTSSSGQVLRASATMETLAPATPLNSRPAPPRPSSLQSFRNWLPAWTGLSLHNRGYNGRNNRSGIPAAQPSEASTSSQQTSTAPGGPGLPPPHHQQLLWRRSQPSAPSDAASAAAYGFIQQRVYPASCHYLSSLATGAAGPQHHQSLALPSYVWDPPPPYSQPSPSAAAQQGGNSSSAGSVAPAATTTTATTTSSALQTSGTVEGPPEIDLNQSCPGPMASSSTPRTTKSGLLLPSSSPEIVNTSRGSPEAQQHQQHQQHPPLDRSIESAMHLYEKAQLGHHSLPSRRLKKAAANAPNEEASHLVLARSVAHLPDTVNALNLEEQVLVREVRQKLNALLLYKYQHTKATRELAEVREALSNLQQNIHGVPQPLSTSSPAGGGGHHKGLISPTTTSTSSAAANSGNSAAAAAATAGLLPLGAAAGGGVGGAGQPRRAGRHASSSAVSDMENKYETIEKSLSPYKINADENSKPAEDDAMPAKKHVQVSIRKKLQLQHRSADTPTSPTSRVSLQKLLSAAAERRVHTAAVSPTRPRDSYCSSSSACPSPIRATPSSFSSASSTSHYAQISPLRGVAATAKNSSYFQEICGHDGSKSHNNKGPSYSSSQSTPTSPLFQLAKAENNYEISKPSESSSQQQQLQHHGLQQQQQLLGKRRTPLFLQQPAPIHTKFNPNISRVTKASSALSLSQAPSECALGIVDPSLAQSVASVPDCVYLRPEQNIPEVFASTTFQPIGNGREREEESLECDKPNSGCSDPNVGFSRFAKDSPARISRDDIVVTVRSAQV